MLCLRRWLHTISIAISINSLWDQSAAETGERATRFDRVHSRLGNDTGVYYDPRARRDTRLISDTYSPDDRCILTTKDEGNRLDEFIVLRAMNVRIVATQCSPPSSAATRPHRSIQFPLSMIEASRNCWRFGQGMLTVLLIFQTAGEREILWLQGLLGMWNSSFYEDLFRWEW